MSTIQTRKWIKTKPTEVGSLLKTNCSAL